MRFSNLIALCALTLASSTFASPLFGEAFVNRDIGNAPIGPDGAPGWRRAIQPQGAPGWRGDTPQGAPGWRGATPQGAPGWRGAIPPPAGVTGPPWRDDVPAPTATTGPATGPV